MDFSSIADAVDFGGVVIALLGIAAVVMAVLVVQWGARKVLALVGGGDSYSSDGFDPWDGYTAEDDARDVAAHNAGVSAYDAGYMGREFDASWGEGARASWEDGNDARREDEIRYG